MKDKTQPLERPMRCDDCQRDFSPGDLDTVLMDEAATKTTDEVYCRDCWPRHRIVKTDKWSGA